MSVGLEHAIFSNANDLVYETTHMPRHPVTIQSPDVFVVEIDRKILYKQKVCMADHHLNDELVRVSGCKQFPLTMVRLVYALQKAVYLCEELDGEGDSDDADIPIDSSGGGGEDSNEAAEDRGGKKPMSNNKKKKKKKVLVEKPMFESQDGNVVDRVEEYVETVRAIDDSVLGWRLWFVVRDPSFDLDKALLSEFYWNREELKALRYGGSISGKTQELYVVDETDWIMRIANYYTMPSETRANFNKRAPTAELHYPLHHANNMASCRNLFRATDAISESIFLGTSVNPDYIQPDNYLMAYQIRFPHGALYVPRAERHPDFFHHVVLVENAMTRRPLLRLSQDHALKVIQEKREVVQLMRLRTSSEGNVLTQVLEANEADLMVFTQRERELERKIHDSANLDEGEVAALVEQLEQERIKVAQRMNQWHTSPEILDRINILFTSPDALSPGYAACVRWVIDQMNDAAKSGKKWSAMRTEHAPLDRDLNVFAHFITRELFLYEHVIGVTSMHQELLFLMIHRLNSFDVRRDRLKSNIVFIGPAAAGKSMQLRFTKECSVPGWFRDITMETKKAYATDANFDQMGFFHDELGEQYLEGGDTNEGSSLIKTMLSEKKLETNTIDVETRTTRTYVALMDIQMFACTNADRDKIPPPLATRFLISEVSQYKRPGVDMSLKESELQSDVRDKNAYAVLRDELRVVQSMACLVDMLIAVKILPQIDMTAAHLYLAAVTAQLLKNSISIEPRMRTQIENCVRDCAMYEAVRRVFCTFEVFPGDPVREFKYSDLLRVRPYLFATEQHVVFTLTHMRDIIVDSSKELVIDILVKMTIDQQVPKFLHVGVDANGHPIHDFNYFFIDTGMGSDSEKILTNLAKKINDTMKQRSQRVLHLPMIKKVLRTLSCESLQFGQRYESADVLNTNAPPENQLLLRIESDSGKTGVAVSRHFMKQKQDMKEKDVILAAIDTLSTKHTPKRRLVTGNTMRSTVCMYPYLVTMYEQAPDPSKETLAQNLAYRAPGFGECLGGKERKNAHDTAYLTLDRSVEVYCYEKFFTANQIEEEMRPRNFPVDVPSPEQQTMDVESSDHPERNGRYPDWIIEHDKKKCANAGGGGFKRTNPSGAGADGSVDKRARHEPAPRPATLAEMTRAAWLRGRSGGGSDSGNSNDDDLN